MAPENKTLLMAIFSVVAVSLGLFFSAQYLSRKDVEAYVSPAYAGDLSRLADPEFVSGSSWSAMVAGSFDAKAASSILGRSQFRSLDARSLPSLDACRNALVSMAETLMMTDQNFTHVDVRGLCLNENSGKGVTFSGEQIYAYGGT